MSIEQENPSTPWWAGALMIVLGMVACVSFAYALASAVPPYDDRLEASRGGNTGAGIMLGSIALIIVINAIAPRTYNRRWTWWRRWRARRELRRQTRASGR